MVVGDREMATPLIDSEVRQSRPEELTVVVQEAPRLYCTYDIDRSDRQSSTLSNCFSGVGLSLPLGAAPFPCTPTAQPCQFSRSHDARDAVFFTLTNVLSEISYVFLQ